MSFHWKFASPEIGKRYSEDANGFSAWKECIAYLDNLNDYQRAASDYSEEQLLRATQALSMFSQPRHARSMAPTVFISHQSNDVAYAERAAWLACQEGIDYWLDVHDPTLTHANKTIPKNSAVYPVLIAAIIEMALLNSSHLVAIHTKTSHKSRWVPYEFGRVRDQLIQSKDCGSWFHPMTRQADHGDYLQLARATQGGESDITRWLRQWSSSALRIKWRYPYTPPKLPI